MQTPEIDVSVQTRYLPEASAPLDEVYSFAYTIRIRNLGAVPGQLIARHWIIEDSDGLREEVRGLGVVGHQPLLQPGESFEYTSGCRLHTPTGTMRGRYRFVTDEGEPFDVPIAPFTLDATGHLGPRTLH
ncbi:Co2+/Mg2+ efflux protein ApaG [Tibeticola sp.]|jgi:ApaG protein|uniref:Co2+/Mg2+ efflux protein ApaG n=1 Tax=Tibeticola sp. TaxID=2005368 RepID=UPI0025DF0870|nr:Co2+/Mg2+ efflux protein ApaG [Tibeticola sp.]